MKIIMGELLRGHLRIPMVGLLMVCFWLDGGISKISLKFSPAIGLLMVSHLICGEKREWAKSLDPFPDMC